MPGTVAARLQWLRQLHHLRWLRSRRQLRQLRQCGPPSCPVEHSHRQTHPSRFGCHFGHFHLIPWQPAAPPWPAASHLSPPTAHPWLQALPQELESVFGFQQVVHLVTANQPGGHCVQQTDPQGTAGRKPVLYLLLQSGTGAFPAPVPSAAFGLHSALLSAAAAGLPSPCPFAPLVWHLGLLHAAAEAHDPGLQSEPGGWPVPLLSAAFGLQSVLLSAGVEGLQSACPLSSFGPHLGRSSRASAFAPAAPP
mmetsp:Transcript_124932/g.216575  ORF Transcript_124932/g.216575 Transcript_124932/m.216575 type:complete len:251 (-) Transcript_124932:1459-2211(-)